MNRAWWMVLMIPLWAIAVAPGCQQAQSGPIKTTPIVAYDLPITRVVTDYEEFPGSTEAIFSVQVRARVSGYMTQVYFTDGVLVGKDDKLFEIDPRLYRADLERAVGTVAQYEAHLERLKREYLRAKSLLARGSISQEEHDRYEADHKESTANLEVAKANRDLARLNVEWTEVRAPIAGMLSRRMVDPGNLVKADDTVLTSIVSLDPLYVYFDVHEQAMLRLKRLMQEGRVKVTAQGAREVPVQIGLSDEKDFPHEGIVDFTDNRVDPNTGTLRFRAKIANPPDRYGNRFIVPGLFVRVRLPIGDPHPALLIREQSLVTDQGRKTVWVVKEKSDERGQPVRNEKGEPVYTAAVRDVGTPGVLRGVYREVEKGVQPGDRVVVAGIQRLRPGIEVKIEKLDENPAAGPAPPKDASGSKREEPARPGTSPVGTPAGAGAPSQLGGGAGRDGPALAPVLDMPAAAPGPPGPAGTVPAPRRATDAAAESQLPAPRSSRASLVPFTPPDGGSSRSPTSPGPR